MNDQLKPLLTDLRAELNQLNSLNCVVHKYQGDFSVSERVANQLCEGAMHLYTEHLKNNVAPRFVALGKLLVELGEETPLIFQNDPLVDEDYSMIARYWYQNTYETGVLW